MPQMYRRLRGLLYSPYSPRVFRRSHLRRQMNPRPPTTREILVAKGGTMWARINWKFCLRLDFHVNSGIFYMPQIYDMGPTALLPFRRKACWGIFRPEKSWWPGLNPRTWVLKGSTLLLDHRSRLYETSYIAESDHFPEHSYRGVIKDVNSNTVNLTRRWTYCTVHYVSLQVDSRQKFRSIKDGMTTSML